MSQLNRGGRSRRGLAASAVIAIGAFGLFAGASAAQAVNIDEDRQGSLTVHKFEAPGGGQMNPDNTGTQPSSKAIDGVVFEYCRIDGVDLFDGTNKGWDRLGQVTEAQLVDARSGLDLADLSLSNCASMPATVNGIATSGELDLGAYLVREKETPAHVTKKAEPFIVTIPTPGINQGEGDGTWVYDVHLYPKNDVGDSPSKTIQNQPSNGFTVGSEVNYQISQKAPVVQGDSYVKFVVTDTLDPRLKGSKAPVVSIDGVALADTEYTAEWVTAGSPEQSTLTVSLQGALASLTAGQVVTVDFVATVVSIGDGEIMNQGVVNVNDLDVDGDGTPGTPTDKVWTRWGGVLMQKVDADGSGNGLEGAVFQVLMSEKSADCRLDEGLTPVTNADGSPFEAVSGADGQISIAGLWIGDDELQGGEMTNGLEERCYVLVETKAPNGFVLPTGDLAKTEVIVKPGEVATVSKQIENKQQDVPELPLTGAAGQVLMVIGGLALVAIAGGSVVLSRRKNAAL